MPTVSGARNKRLPRSDMFANRIAQVFDEEPAVPIDDHRSVVVGPTEMVRQLRMTAVSPHHLKTLDAHRRSQPAIVCVRIIRGSTHVTHRLMDAAGLSHECGWRQPI